jgi:HSF-type DNA-binding
VFPKIDCKDESVDFRRGDWKNPGATLTASSPTLDLTSESTIDHFPKKLMEIVQDIVDRSMFAWLPDGKSFVVLDSDRFLREIIHSSFPSSANSKYGSFIRKLNRWGFRRLAAGTGIDCFHHEFFDRNHPEWVSKMKPIATKGRRENKKNVASTLASQDIKLNNKKPAEKNDTYDHVKASLDGIEKFVSFPRF